MKCRHCGAQLSLPMLDLGAAPPSNAYLSEAALHAPEKWFPLRVLVCEQCWLAQTEDFAQADELFDAAYAYFSGFSSMWLSHCSNYVSEMISRFALNSASHVIEVAANDGSLLQFFSAQGIPCLGIEPTASTAAAARQKGLSIVQSFFGIALARTLKAEGKQADLMVGNNVLAHVPNINDFIQGFSILLKPLGVVTFEFPHLFRTISENQFDTIYHEHFSYLSLTAVHRILAENGLDIFDVEELPTHGGSLRVFAQRQDSGQYTPSPRVDELLQLEEREGLKSVAYFEAFQIAANRVKNDFLTFLLDARKDGKTVAAYGAAAKGNTLLNYAGVRPDLLSYVVDRNPAKQGQFMPGSRIPIVDESRLQHEQPDYVVILPWNLKSEIMHQLEYIRSWGGRFVTAVPELSITS